MEHRSAPKTIVAAYREYVPPPELRAYVGAPFWFGPSQGDVPSGRRALREFRFARDDVFFSPSFADGHASLIFDLGRRYDHAHGWQPAHGRTHAAVLGPLTSAGAAPSLEPPAMIGVYLRPRSYSELLGATRSCWHCSRSS